MPGQDQNPDTVSFGFEEVPREEKSRRVRDVFARVAGRYDLMNDLMSAGLHRAWKDALADRANPQPGEIVVDVAGGTGDVARRLKDRADRAAARRGRESAVVLVTDVNARMLAEGRRRGVGGLLWACADGERLPLARGSVDLVTVSFGIRNMTDIAAALSEARRVLKPGGRFLCLEFSRLAVVGLQGAYDAYSFKAIPAIGRLVAQDEESYRYLAESIRRFPDQETFADMLRQAGFSRVDYTNMAGGVAALHIGWAV